MTGPEILPPLPSLPKMQDQISIDERGRIWLSDPLHPSGYAVASLQHGLTPSWTHSAELDRIILCFATGTPNAPGETLVTSLSVEGLRELILDLQSIEPQMGSHP